MRIATVTCHEVYNYGASLQAYALQEFCTSLGHDYKIIDYKPTYLSYHYRLDAINNQKYDKPFIRQLYLLAKLPGRLLSRRRKRFFDRFTAQYLHLTDKRYRTAEELKSQCPPADLFIAGSDQIWNTFFKNGRDSVFYLDFVNNRTRKISYAASFATDRIFNGADEFVKKKLQNFDSISVRETSALKLLSSLGIDNAQLVCDPVFLLKAEDWRKFARGTTKAKGEYILVYDCERSRELRKIAEQLKAKTKLPVYRLCDTFGHYADRNLSNSGPLEFVSLIANARYVVANSFHALAFSIIFQKDFYIVNRNEQINTRMRDFLDYLGLSNRLISGNNEIEVEKIDFSQANSSLETLVEKSQEFIAQQTS